MAYTFALANVITIKKFILENFIQPVYTGGFNRDAFWDEFAAKNVIKNEQELVEVVIDMARCHWSPNVENWPGMDITVGYGAGADNWKFHYDAGKSKAKNFEKGKKVYSWTNACLATAGIFEEVFRKGDNGLAMCQTINGNSGGSTQFMTTVHDFTPGHLKECEDAFEAWITTVGAKARDPKVTAKVKAAARNAIANRTRANAAYGVKNVCRYLTGVATEEGDNPAFTKP